MKERLFDITTEIKNDTYCSSETGEKLTAEITDSKDIIIEEE